MEMTIDQLIQSAEAGDKTAMYKLGYKYMYGEGVAKNVAGAMVLYEESAKQGYAPAQYMMGWYEKDSTKAFKWYKLAADQGNIAAIYMVGIAYQGGKGVEKDTVEAIKYFYQAAMGGDTKGALSNLIAHYIGGDVPQEYYSACLKCFLKYSDIDWVQSELGNICQKGIGVEKDEAKAVKWYTLAAEQGHGISLYKLGECYEEGIGVEKDISTAMNYYEMSAKRDVRAAKIKLGLVIDTSSVPSDLSNSELSLRGDNYFYGRCGYSQNYAEAIKYYYKAATKGDVISQNDVGNCFYNGNGCKQNYIQAMEWFNKAAKQGYMYAQYNLAWSYEHGEGVEKDLALAVKYYKQAADQGHSQAERRLEQLQSLPLG